MAHTKIYSININKHIFSQIFNSYREFNVAQHAPTKKKIDDDDDDEKKKRNETRAIMISLDIFCCLPI